MGGEGGEREREGGREEEEEERERDDSPAFSDSLYSVSHWTQVKMGSGPLGLPAPSSSNIDTRSSSDCHYTKSVIRGN